jgi:hypothetical protein
MFLDEHINESIKLVYQLKEDLKINFERLEKAQALTLNPNKPFMGLKGSCGLFGSDKWWDSIEKGVMPVCIMQGAIVRAYVAGKDRNGSSPNDMIEVLLEDGSVCHDGIYTNDKSDVRLFVPGARVALAYIYDELKAQPASDGGINYARVVLEMAVSI